MLMFLVCDYTQIFYVTFHLVTNWQTFNFGLFKKLTIQSCLLKQQITQE